MAKVHHGTLLSLMLMQCVTSLTVASQVSQLIQQIWNNVSLEAIYDEEIITGESRLSADGGKKQSRVFLFVCFLPLDCSNYTAH